MVFKCSAAPFAARCTVWALETDFSDIFDFYRNFNDFYLFLFFLNFFSQPPIEIISIGWMLWAGNFIVFKCFAALFAARCTVWALDTGFCDIVEFFPQF